MTVRKRLLSKLKRARKLYEKYSKILYEVEISLIKLAEKYGLYVMYHDDDEIWTSDECLARIPTNKGELCIKEDGSVYLEEVVFEKAKIYRRVRRLE